MFKYAIRLKNVVPIFGSFDSPIEVKDFLVERGWKQSHPISTNWKHWTFIKNKLTATIENVQICEPLEKFESEHDV